MLYAFYSHTKHSQSLSFNSNVQRQRWKKNNNKRLFSNLVNNQDPQECRIEQNMSLFQIIKNNKLVNHSQELFAVHASIKLQYYHFHERFKDSRTYTVSGQISPLSTSYCLQHNSFHDSHVIRRLGVPLGDIGRSSLLSLPLSTTSRYDAI